MKDLKLQICPPTPQGYCIENTRLVVRYPDRRTQRVLPIPLKMCLPVTQQAGASAG